MDSKPKENLVPVEEMVGERSPELARKIAERIKFLKFQTFRNFAITIAGLGMTVTAAGLVVNEAKNTDTYIDPYYVAASIAGASSVLAGSVGVAKSMSEASALTGALAKHLLDSVEKTNTAGSPKLQP
jgi:hypothetical protein